MGGRCDRTFPNPAWNPCLVASWEVNLQPAPVHRRPAENLPLPPPLRQDANLRPDRKLHLWNSSFPWDCDYHTGQQPAQNPCLHVQHEHCHQPHKMRPQQQQRNVKTWQHPEQNTMKGQGESGKQQRQQQHVSITHYGMHLIMGVMSLWTRLPGSVPVYRAPKSLPLIQLSRPTAGACRCGNTATSPNVDERNHVIDHRHLSLHTTGMQQRVQNTTSSTVGARLSPPRLHSRSAGPTQQTSTTLSMY